MFRLTSQVQQRPAPMLSALRHRLHDLQRSSNTCEVSVCVPLTFSVQPGLCSLADKFSANLGLIST